MIRHDSSSARAAEPLSIPWWLDQNVFLKVCLAKNSDKSMARTEKFRPSNMTDASNSHEDVAILHFACMVCLAVCQCQGGNGKGFVGRNWLMMLRHAVLWKL